MKTNTQQNDKQSTAVYMLQKGFKMLKLGILLLGVCLTTCATPSYADAKLRGLDARQVDCLAKNVYFESRGESEKGQLAVLYTTLNRMKHPNFPSDACQVVYERNQFSWTRTKRNAPIKEKTTYSEIKNLVNEVLAGQHKDVSKGATYFHANTIRKPNWTRSLNCTTSIGRHVFYKTPK